MSRDAIFLDGGRGCGMLIGRLIGRLIAAARAGGVDDAKEAKVRNLGDAIAQQDVLRLEVSVGDGCAGSALQVVHASGDIEQPTQGRRDRVPALADLVQ